MADHAHDHAHGHRHDDGHDHRHGHAHGHAAPPADGYERAYAIGIGLNLTFVVIEVTAGLLSGSLALVADAAHNLTDALALVLAWGAARLARRMPSARMTYGLRRSSILASLINAVALLIGVGGIAVEALHRFVEPSPVDATIIIWVAALGIAVNGGSALLFIGGRHGELNARAAFLHQASDALVAAGVVLSGILIAWTGAAWLDPLTSLGVAAIIVTGSWSLLRESVNLALDGVPAEIDPNSVRDFLAGLPGVCEVHDLHIWAMSTTETALTVHLVRPDEDQGDTLLAMAAEGLQHRFSIGHATFQIERGQSPCALAPAETV